MSCSCCNVPGHRVTSCQSIDLLHLMDKLEKIVRNLKYRPLLNVDSRALNLHRHICDLQFNEIKGVSAKLGICITGKRKEFLTWCIVKRLWFRETPNYVMNLCDFIYLYHLDRMIGGMHSTISWAEYTRSMDENNMLITSQIRSFNIDRMIRQSTSYDRMLRDDMPGFLEFIHPLRTRDGLLRLFGDRINLSDVCDHIPSICRFYQPNFPTGPPSPFSSFTERRDKLELTCEYVATLEKTAEEGCAICMSDTKCDTILNCGHMFCIDCVVATVKTALRDNNHHLRCAMCRAETKCIKSTDVDKIDNLVHLLK